MARVRADQPLIPSVLDRLIDDDPTVSVEAASNRNQILRDLKKSLQRDIENLLNTRRRIFDNLKIHPEIEKSILTYGVPDFSGAGPSGGKDRQAFCLLIEKIIIENEPRLLRVKVELLSKADPGDRTLRFRIDALMRADPAPEPVAFDSTMEPSTSAFTIQSGAAA